MDYWLLFMLILTRVTSFFVTLPFISYRGIPQLLKVFFGLTVSYLIFLSATFEVELLPAGNLEFVFYLAYEALIGLGLGFVVLLFFSLFRMAGQMIDMMMGLQMASVFDPQLGSPATLMGQLYYLLALVYYLTINGHHHLFLALSKSYELIPVGGGRFFTDVSVFLLAEMFYGVFALAFQIAAPAIVVVVITDISLGLVSKTVPQLQVFIVGLPLKISLGLIAVYLTLPFLGPVLEDIFKELYNDLIRIMVSLT